MSAWHGGGCLCGAVRFRVQGPPRWVAHCHCQSCRRSTGAALTTYLGLAREQVVFEPDARRLHASSPGVSRGFCGQCGSPISFESDRWPGELHLHVSSLDRPQDFPPTAHVFHGERLPWLELHDALPRYRGSAGRDARPDSYGPCREPEDGSPR